MYTEEDIGIHKADNAFSGLHFTTNLLRWGIFMGRWPALGEGGGGDGWGGGHALRGEDRCCAGAVGLWRCRLWRPASRLPVSLSALVPPHDLRVDSRLIRLA